MLGWDGVLAGLPGRLGDEDRQQLGKAVRAVEPELTELCDEVSRCILRLQPNLVDRSDRAAVTAVHRATIANVGAILSTLAFAVRPSGMDVPDGALDLLDHVAREPAALPVMLRAYRLGAAGFNQLWHAHLAGFAADGAQLDRLARYSLDHVAVYVDRISEVIVERWEAVSVAAARAGRRREAMVRALLSGETADATLLGYPLDVPQLVLAHCPPAGGQPEGLLERVAHLAQMPPTLELELGEGVTLVWVAVSDPDTLMSSVLDVAGQLHSGWTVAMAAGPGLDAIVTAGRDVREALVALRRVRPAGGAVRQADLALVATLLADEERAARLVQSVLGSLADPTERNLVLCDTLRAYFQAGERKTGAAALLGVHEKTVAYRLEQAESLIGGRVSHGRAALESALLVHHALIRPGVRPLHHSS